MDQFRESFYQDTGGFETQSYHSDGYTKTTPVTATNQTKKFRLVTSSDLKPASTIEKEFARLSKRWKADVVFSSSSHQHYFHPSYQRIIGMGKDALPLIFQDLRTSDSDWFWALQCITGVDPVRKSDWGNFQKQKAAWERWAKKKFK